MARPLDGVTVLDLTRLLPGAYCTLMLADMGADVVKVEEPGVGDYMRTFPPFMHEQSAFFLVLNRNKRSLSLNLKSHKGRRILYELAAKSQVIVEGFRPGVAKRLRIDYDVITKVNPRIVYCSITGYGQDGTYRDLAGHDINYAAMGGLLSVTWTRDGLPVLPGVNVADLAGGLAAATGILAGLHYSARTGKGLYLDISMLDCVISLLCLHAAIFFATGTSPSCRNYLLSGAYPYYGVYQTKDEKFITLGALEPRFWRNFCVKVGREDLIALHWNLEKAEYVRSTLEGIFRQRTRDEWFAFCKDIDACVAPVHTLREVFADANTRARGMRFEVIRGPAGRIDQVGLPIKFAGTTLHEPKAPPRLGQDTHAILKALGYSGNAITKLARSGVV